MSVADVRRVAQGRWVALAGRLGHAARGALYAIVGLLAIQIPLGLGGRATDRQGALRTVAQQPLGEVLLLALALALAGFAVWRLAQALFARRKEGGGRPGMLNRLGYLALGFFYAATSLLALTIVAGVGISSGNEKRETARVFDLPLGRYAVAAVGLGFLAAGLFSGFRSLTARFRNHLKEHELGDAAQTWAIAVGVFGHAARAVVFSLVGVFLLRAAIQYDSKEAIGLDGALRTLAEQAYGPLLLGLVAAGLIAYALYCFVLARYADV